MRHGGDLDEARRLFGEAAHGWIDLSTGINPHPYPLQPMPKSVLSRLPSPGDVGRLERAAGAAYRTEGAIVAGPGTQAILQVLPGLLGGPRVAVVGPTYGGHASAWASSGIEARVVGELDADAGDVVVVVNPNNPDGRRFAPARLLETADRLGDRGGLLVVDEAFADLVPEAGIADRAGRPGLLVLRSFGKAYGLAGLRLGFAIGPDALIERLRGRLGDWAVSGPALHAGLAALPDRDWLAAARLHLGEASARLDSLLRDGGCGIVGGTPLFRLASHEDAAGLHARLARAGVWTRIFAGHPGWIRVGYPADEAAWAQLGDALREAT